MSAFYPSFALRFFTVEFALEVAQLVGLLVLVGLSFGLCQPWFVAGSKKPTCFGFRWALLLGTFASILTVTAVAVEVAQAPGAGYMGILGIISTVVGGIGRAVLAFAMIRTALYPLREAGVVHRDRGLAIGVATFWVLIWVVLVVLASYAESIYIRESTGAPASSTFDYRALIASYVTGVISIVAYAVTGLVGLTAAVYALRKSVHLDIHPDLRRGIKLMIAVGSLWTIQGLISIIILGLEAGSQGRGSLTFNSVGAEMVIQVVTVLQVLITFTLFVVCFRKPKDTLPM